VLRIFEYTLGRLYGEKRGTGQKQTETLKIQWSSPSKSTNESRLEYTMELINTMLTYRERTLVDEKKG